MTSEVLVAEEGAVPVRAFKPSRGGASRRAAHWWTPWAFAAPGLILFFVIIGYPLLRSLQISFYKWAVLPTDASTFIGLDNYTRALHDPQFWTSMVNAGVYLVLSVPLTMALGLFFAVLLHAKIPGRTVYRVLFYIPVVTSWVVVSLLFKFLFTTDGGAVNWGITDLLPLTNSPVPWLEQRWTGLIAIAVLGIWKNMGWCLVVFLAALGGVGEDQYEAADLDGANAWKKFLHVTMPGIRGTFLFVLVLQVIGAFNVLQSVLLMTNGGPAGSTEVPLTYMYKQAFSFLDFGYASAMSFILAIIIFIVSFIQFKFLGEKKEPQR
ncbi:carbohydrate ABC transporter membrane protein 1, CUT1 family [Nakamurella panacisegetis]|uniref:Carbohydrate ABC transporter membrane protein 1, CUT1 family n=1 Tax=Nakamurella panacisegetis TaxID=1090615 RepID=A0A1H0LID5_9ACTN|nr:sugar ABC transporter permease [Nakamurella panacisegetis]SDO67825.1 carbohydrate ABC transporter membrane protein 1, CUT1 family [Nakamurella panacisegetis]